MSKSAPPSPARLLLVEDSGLIEEALKASETPPCGMVLDAAAAALRSAARGGRR